MNTPNPSLTISTVAKRAGVPIDTIRYYEREGLLSEPLGPQFALAKKLA